jgi:hypothetical protein
VTETRPPIELTAGEASNWFSIHPEDVGRQVVIVRSHVKDCPPEHVAAFAGFGRWQAGFAGRWPERTVIADDLIARPPTWVVVEGGRVHFDVMGARVTYRRVRARGPLRLMGSHIWRRAA